MGIKLINESGLSSVADAIRAKTGTSETLEWPQGYIDAVEAIPTGGGPVSVPAKEVNFRDYDGTVVYSYTPAEFAALSAMPANPDHSGDEIPLTSQGWNWSFADAQAYVAKYGRLEVGQMYATTDGKTHVLIHLEQGRTSPILGVCPNGTVDVDWGDGTAHGILTGTSTSDVQWTNRHYYAAPGNYDIKLTAVTGEFSFNGDDSTNTYAYILRYSSGSSTLNRGYLTSIRSVRLGANVPEINSYAFYYCSNLSSITISNGTTNFKKTAFQNCYSLTSITIPYGVTGLSNTMFRGCYSLKSISIPKSVTGIYGNCFYVCYSLTNINIPDAVTDIDTTVFYSCIGLACITIPASVTSIGSNAFQNCYYLGVLRFLSATPPSVSNSNAFANVPTDCKIYVPAASLDTYKSATNYPSASSYTYIGE